MGAKLQNGVLFLKTFESNFFISMDISNFFSSLAVFDQPLNIFWATQKRVPTPSLNTRGLNKHAVKCDSWKINKRYQQIS